MYIKFEFNVFSYKLRYSRYCYFEYRKEKTQQDVFECLISAFKQTGGVPKEIFGTPMLAQAILERLLHHSHVISIKGEDCLD